MKRFLLISVSFVLAIALHIGSQADAFDISSMSGTVTCTSTTFVDSGEVAIGRITLVADGQGDWTSGSANYRLAGVADNVGCTYVLDGGEYSVYADGTGASVTSWSLVAANSSPGCAQLVRNSSSSFSLLSSSFSWTQGGRVFESGTCTRQ